MNLRAQRAETARPPRPTALITGGSRGIGLALARQFARNGHDLVLVARDQAALERAAADLSDRYGCAVTVVGLDLAADDAPARLIDGLQAQGIQVDVLVNNAGVGDYGPLAQTDPERLNRMLRLNVLAFAALIRSVLPGMIERGRGRILNTASVVAFFAGGANWAAYVASKHFVLALTRGLRIELAGTSITATALCPGPAATEFAVDSGVGGSGVYRWFPKVRPEAVARAGYRACMSGASRVTPGMVNKLLAFLGELPPRGIAQTVFSILLRDRKRPSETTGPVSRGDVETTALPPRPQGDNQ